MKEKEDWRFSDASPSPLSSSIDWQILFMFLSLLNNPFFLDVAIYCSSSRSKCSVFSL